MLTAHITDVLVFDCFEFLLFLLLAAAIVFVWIIIILICYYKKRKMACNQQNKVLAVSIYI